MNLYYELGIRDSIASLFCSINSIGVEQTIRQLANEYEKRFNDKNVHIEKFLKETKSL